jgi:hypothetical protein
MKVHRPVVRCCVPESRPNLKQMIPLRSDGQLDPMCVPVAHHVLLTDAPKSGGLDADGVAAGEKVQVAAGHLRMP